MLWESPTVSPVVAIFNVQIHQHFHIYICYCHMHNLYIHRAQFLVRFRASEGTILTFLIPWTSNLYAGSGPWISSQNRLECDDVEINILPNFL